MSDDSPSSRPSTEAVGERIIRVSWVSAIVFAITAVSATISPGWLRWPALVVAVAMFAAGTAIFVWAFLVAVERSRTDAIGIGGLFFLAGSAPRRVRFSLMGALAFEVVVAFVTASVRIFSTLAFGALAPMLALALAGLWGAKFGTFGVRRP